MLAPLSSQGDTPSLPSRTISRAWEGAAWCNGVPALQRLSGDEEECWPLKALAGQLLCVPNPACRRRPLGKLHKTG